VLFCLLVIGLDVNCYRRKDGVESLLHLGILCSVYTSLMFITPETVKIGKAKFSFTNKTKNLSKKLDLQFFITVMTRPDDCLHTLWQDLNACLLALTPDR